MPGCTEKKTCKYNSIRFERQLRKRQLRYVPRVRKFYVAGNSTLSVVLLLRMLHTLRCRNCMFGSACELLYVYVYVLYARYVMLETERKLLTQSI